VNNIPKNLTSSGLADNRPEDHLALPSPKKKNLLLNSGMEEKANTYKTSFEA
jgi:hypothetical protein